MIRKKIQSFDSLKTARSAASKTPSASGRTRVKVLPSVVISKVAFRGQWSVATSTTCLKMSKVSSSSATSKCPKWCCQGAIPHCLKIDLLSLKLARIPQVFSKAQAVLPSRSLHCQRSRLAPPWLSRASVTSRSMKWQWSRTRLPCFRVNVRAAC